MFKSSNAVNRYKPLEKRKGVEKRDSILYARIKRCWIKKGWHDINRYKATVREEGLKEGIEFYIRRSKGVRFAYKWIRREYKEVPML